MDTKKDPQFHYPEEAHAIDTTQSKKRSPQEREGLPEQHANAMTAYDEPEADPEPEEFVEQKETVVEEVAEELHVGLPKVNLPLPMKLVAALSLVAGLGLLSSLFTGAFSGHDDSTTFEYILSLTAGALLIGTSYGLIKRQNWATWLYGLLVFMSFFINWKLSIIPLGFLIYMILNRRYLRVSIFDKAVQFISKKIQKQLK